MALLKSSHYGPSSRRRLVGRSALSAAALACSIVACSASDGGGASVRQGAGEQEGPSFFEPDPQSNANPMGNGGGVGGFVEAQPPPSGAIDVDEACVIDRTTAELVEQPVDIILLLDNSGSMSDELEAVEQNINLNFASILASSAVDYRMILISRHRREVREESGESSTSICVSAPLSGLADCAAAPEPTFSERFFQYSTKLESTDSFDILLDTFAPPFDDSEREEKFDNAPLGWSAWLRPGAKKVFLEVTDDNEDMPVNDFLSQLTTLAPGQFGSDPQNPNFVFHSIIGVAEKAPASAAYLPAEPIQMATCTGNGNVVENSGVTYQELSRLTGGLRFPLCQFGAYDVVFQRIAEDVVLTSGIACDFPIPAAPQGSELDLNNVAIQYNPGSGGAPLQFGQAPASGACQADAFYIANDRLNLCPAACSLIRSDPRANVAVLFTCESQLIVPR